ncbi:histidine kinase-like ATPase [Obelidium mucronatum]|nr:histidine kinase-like ATPase [Obelidium mucronatum]
MLRLDLTDFIVTELVTEVIESFRAQLLSKKITFELQFKGSYLEENPNQVLFGDHADVKHIKVITSVDDVAEFSPKAALRVDVQDSGIGMTDEEKTNLFQRFQQASVKTYSQYGGSGLGLFISKNLVTEMDGRFEVESTKGQGTSFSFVIPLELRSSLVDNSAQSTQSLNKPFNSLSLIDESSVILVVDDNDINRKILTTILKKAVMDGKEATRKIRQREELNSSPSIPIVAVTGNARSEQIKELIDLGMQAVVVKPFKPAELSFGILYRSPYTL